MKSTRSSHRPAFTIVELLVVVAIIAILASFAIGAAIFAQRKAQMTAASSEVSSLVNAIKFYYSEYNNYPPIGSTSGDTIVQTDAQLMNILMAIGPDGERDNSKQTPFYSGRDATGSPGKEYNGLLRTGNSVELFDVWRKTKAGAQRHYFIMWDSNHDGRLINPFTNETTFQTVLVWSTGRDGQEVRGKENDPKNRDNVTSW